LEVIHLNMPRNSLSSFP